MPGEPEASILIMVKDRPTTVVSTGDLATRLDEVQFSKRHGPCMHAATTGDWPGGSVAVAVPVPRLHRVTGW